VITSEKYYSSVNVYTLDSVDKFEAIEELIGKAPVFSTVPNQRELVEAVIERENLQTTACGHGIAFAHGKTDQVKQVTPVLGVSRDGIKFNSPDGRPVHFLFIIASPRADQLEYLTVLSSIARICHGGFGEEALGLLTEEKLEKKVTALLKKHAKVKRTQS
jgi:PTS system nitrogen regulatory IIA component